MTNFCVSPAYDDLGLPVSAAVLSNIIVDANAYLVDMPRLFGPLGSVFYKTLNIRNVSGLVGEVIKHSLAPHVSGYLPNPHPDGRPDLIDVSAVESQLYLKDLCFDPWCGKPIKKRLAPYHHGGMEIKCTVGNSPTAPVGQPRMHNVTSLSFWAHHQHACKLLACYFDFVPSVGGCPQVLAVFYQDIQKTDWTKVSIGNAKSKKTSNTRLKPEVIARLCLNVAIHEDSPAVIELLTKLRASRPKLAIP